MRYPDTRRSRRAARTAARCRRPGRRAPTRPRSAPVTRGVPAHRLRAVAQAVHRRQPLRPGQRVAEPDRVPPRHALDGQPLTAGGTGPLTGDLRVRGLGDGERRHPERRDVDGPTPPRRRSGSVTRPGGTATISLPMSTQAPMASHTNGGRTSAMEFGRTRSGASGSDQVDPPVTAGAAANSSSHDPSDRHAQDGPITPHHPVTSGRARAEICRYAPFTHVYRS